MHALLVLNGFLYNDQIDIVETLLNYIRELLGSNLKRDTVYITEILSGLPQFLEANAAKLSRIDTMTVPFQILSSSSHILPLDCLYWEIQRRIITHTMKGGIGKRNINWSKNFRVYSLLRA
jgi:hypothetical protein